MTALEEIEHRLSFLPEYLKYRAECLEADYERWGLLNYRQHKYYGARSFDTWMHLLFETGEDDLFVYMENRDGFKFAQRKINWDI